MASLGVQLPDMITRVSEYIPEIIAFVQRLFDNGFAYSVNGSVYFDTAQYTKSGHQYGKLMPEQIGNSALLAEGEGSLTSSVDEKKSPADFVLWKKTKEAVEGIVEPSWESPWGPGRPGWHIECSAMARFAFDENYLDIHAGGIDLKFPHHENEIAQSEGFCGCNQWTNYWLHTGHLHIKGLKMSKSLKNFITIREALTYFSARQIRFCFLLQKYNAPMDYSDNTLQQAASIEKIFSEFFHNVKAAQRRLSTKGPQHVGADERSVLQQLETAKDVVAAALYDDFDTPLAVSHLLELIKGVNKYMEGKELVSATLQSVAHYVTSILKTFGLIPQSQDIGFPLDSSRAEGGASKEQILTPYLDAISRFREKVRLSAINGDVNDILSLADDLRDEVMPELGVRLEDIGKGRDTASVWKLEDVEVLRKERVLKMEALKAKEEAKLEAQRKQQEKLEKAKVKPEMMFRGQTNLYSAFDETGLPTHDVEGNPLAKTTIKKLQKEMSKQTELHEKYKDGSQGEGSSA